MSETKIRDIELNKQYSEIIALYKYCKDIGVNAQLAKVYDGYMICFPSGGDFVQHEFSYGSKTGYVEPAIGCRLDYTAVDLEKAKWLVRYHKDRLNKEIRNETEVDS